MSRRGCKPLQPEIRELLRTQGPLTTVRIAVMVGGDITTVRNALKAMPDTYIKCWAMPRREAVWAAVAVPPDCPPPPLQGAGSAA